MKSHIIRTSFVLAVAVPGAVHAAGFQINEHAAAATGRAGAVFATVNDATSVFYNPAGLTGTSGTVFQAGVALIMPSGTYTGTGLPSTNPGGAVVSQSAKSSHQLSEKAFVGFGFYAPYGLGINWVDGDDFVGRTVVKDLSLRSFFLTPTVALKLSENISFALSVSLVPATLGLTRTLGASDNGQVLFPVANGTDGEVELAGTAFGVEEMYLEKGDAPARALGATTGESECQMQFLRLVHHHEEDALGVDDDADEPVED